MEAPGYRGVQLGMAGTGYRANSSRSAESSGHRGGRDCWRGSDFDADAKEEWKKAKQEEGSVTNDRFE